MKLSIGIVGLPNIGKSTLFNILTKHEANAANYPFCTIDPNIGVVAVPDKRIDALAKLSLSVRTVPAVVEFCDIAGLVRGAHSGEGLGNQFLAHIRETNAIVIVLRCFSDNTVIHVEQSVDPLRDLETINTELILKDLSTVEKRLEKAASDVRTGSKTAKQDFEILQSVKSALNRGEFAAAFCEETIVRELHLLTLKRQLYLLNGRVEDVPQALIERIRALGAEYVISNLGTETGVPDLITSAYRTLNLISFFTTGTDETRAWTVVHGARAPEAAGIIHSDFEKNFIRAEVIAYNELLTAGGWQQAKLKGLIRLEGKTYVIRDGDVIVIRHG